MQNVFYYLPFFENYFIIFLKNSTNNIKVFKLFKNQTNNFLKDKIFKMLHF